jgi:ribosomal protein S12 methylthiotransferase accessory factor
MPGGTLDGWVDPVTGVIPSIHIDLPEAGGPKLPLVVSAAPPHMMSSDGSLQMLPLGWGKGLTLADALRSAIGESIERYSASIPDARRIVWARPTDLEGELLGPDEFPLYSEAQYSRCGFPYARFDRNHRHPWIRGTWLGTERPVWVHAVLVYLSLSVTREQLIVRGTSNGLSASIDPHDAAVRATLELVERDAFMATWMTGAPADRVQIDDALDPALRSIIEGIEGLGAVVELYLLRGSACGVTAMALALGDGRNWPGVALGLGADIDPLAATRSAILELGQTGPHLRKLLRNGIRKAPETPEMVVDMLDHAAFYFPAERRGAFDFMRSETQAVSLHTQAAQRCERTPAAFASALASSGVRVACVDVTSPDVALSPFRVARAVSPDLQPISYGYGFDRVPVKRLRARVIEPAPSRIHPIW